MKKGPIFHRSHALRRKCISLIRNGMGVVQAAKELMVSPSSIVHYSRAHPEFHAILAEARMAAIRLKNENVEDALYQKAIDGDVSAVKFWLTNRSPSRWTDRRHIAYQGKVSGQVLHAHLISAAERNIYSQAGPEAVAEAKAALDRYLEAKKSDG